MRMTANLSKFTRIAGFSALIFVAGTAPAAAYVGPGLGLGAVSTALGVVGAIILGILAFIWYPIKRLIRRVRARFANQPTPQPVLRTSEAPARADEVVS